MKTLLAINTLTSVQNQPYASHLNLVYRMGKESDDEILLYTGYRTGIDRFRNMAGQVALTQECDLLMFLDDDVAVPRDTYTKLRKHIDDGADIVTPLIYIRGYPFEPMMFKSATIEGITGLFAYKDWEKEVSAEQPLLPCSAIGFSCCLMRTKLLSEVREPWFITGTNCTEDVYFCLKARNHYENKINILVDTAIRGGHLLDSEFIDFSTRPALQRFYEDLNPSLVAQAKMDRGEDYFRNNIAAIKEKYERA
jgi:GT2 family glycosyltransferase